MDPHEIKDLLDTLNSIGLEPIVMGFCFGAQDEHGHPLCTGPDVRTVRVLSPDGEEFTTQWCAECRALSADEGHEILEVK